MEELGMGAIRHGGGEVARRGDRQTGLPGMRNTADTAFGCHTGASDGLSQAAHSSEVRLNDVTVAAVHQLAKFVARLEKLAGRHGSSGPISQVRQAVEVVCVERRFHEQKLRILDIPQHPERVVRVLPAIADVDHELPLLAYDLT